ncbi:MAG: hypothetical protein K0U49_11500 [Alphaproteobacteria bacterium]|nr:hypothetical protein [Alphaproteobacteria bacterium]
MEQEQFEWIPFFEAIADGLLRYKGDRPALLQEFYEIANSEDYRKIEAVYTDKYKDGSTGRLKDIDPFTVIALLMRTGGKKRNFAAMRLARFLQVDMANPRFYAGAPMIRPEESLFFAYEEERKDGDIDLHWDLLEKAINFADSENNENDEENKNAFVAAFDQSLTVKPIGRKYLTMGLFWVRADFFPVLSTPVCNYIKRKWNVSVDREINGEEYLKIRDNLMLETYRSFPAISHAAYLKKAIR